MRQDASQSIKEFFLQHPASLREHFGNIISKLLKTSVDEDHIVRRNFFNCLEHIFKNSTEQEVQPFFSLIMAHLNCAMTHIKDSVQLDSLRFLDICIKFFPKLFVKDCEKILHSLLNLVSYKQGATSGQHSKGNKRDHKGMPTMGNRIMSVNPTGKISSIKSENDVLRRLLQIATIVLTPEYKNQESGLNNAVSSVYVGASMLNLCLSKYGLSRKFPGNHTSNGTTTDSAGREDPQEKARKLIISYMPFLFKCWNDCSPSCYSIPSPDASRDSSLATMAIIVDIIKLAVASNSTTSSTGETETSCAYINYDDFVKNFMHYFPYSQQQASISRKERKGASDVAKVDIVSLNMHLCEIFSKLSTSETAKGKFMAVIGKNVLKYIKSVIATIDPKSLLCHVETIRDVLKEFCATSKMSLNVSKDASGNGQFFLLIFFIL